MSDHIDRAVEAAARTAPDTPPNRYQRTRWTAGIRRLDAAGLLVTPAHDAEQQRIGAEAALAYVKAEALDPRQAATEGPLVGRILVAHWCDKAASTGADAVEREGGES